MKKLISILFILSITLIPFGMVFRIQRWVGGNIFFSLGLLGIIIYFSAKSIKDLTIKRNDKLNIYFQIILVFMSVTLFSKYLYHRFWDYPSLLIVPAFIITALIYLPKGEKRYPKLTITTILYLALSIPLFGFEFSKSPRPYLPREWFDRYNVTSSVSVQEPFGFKFKQTEQLSIKAFKLRESGYYYDAIIFYRQALKLEPQNPKLFFDLSECYAEINQLETAVSTLDTAILLDSTFAPFYNNPGIDEL